MQQTVTHEPVRCGPPRAADYPVVDFGPVRSTWLRDSEGNLLALNELTGTAP